MIKHDKPSDRGLEDLEDWKRQRALVRPEPPAASTPLSPQELRRVRERSEQMLAQRQRLRLSKAPPEPPEIPPCAALAHVPGRLESSTRRHVQRARSCGSLKRAEEQARRGLWG